MPDATTVSDFTVTLPNDLEYVITRSFAAPRRLVFDAMTKPEHVPHWYGPRGEATLDCEIDLRVGGAYRFVNRAPDGQVIPFYGEYREIEPPQHLVYTWICGIPPFEDHASVITVDLDERDGRTYATVITTCDSKETRDAIVDSGMEHGAREGYDRLDELLATLA